MKATDIQEPRRGDKQIDFDNYCKVIRAVQELLSMRFDGQSFDVQGSAAKSIALRPRPYEKDDFHLTKLGTKSIHVASGLAWCQFQKHSGDDVTMLFTDVAGKDLTLGTQKYAVVYLEVHAKTDQSGGGVGDKELMFAEVFVKESASGFIMKNDVSDNGADHDHYYVPLYSLEAQTGTGTSSDDYRLIHDHRFGVRFTTDIQGYTRKDGITERFLS